MATLTKREAFAWNTFFTDLRHHRVVRQRLFVLVQEHPDRVRQYLDTLPETTVHDDVLLRRLRKEVGYTSG